MSKDPAPANSASEDGKRKSVPIHWARVFAAVLTSKLFFLASCTGGMALGGITDDLLLETGGRQGASGSMVVVAIVPSSNEPGKSALHEVMFDQLDGFKSQHPSYSFLLPIGDGNVSDPNTETRTGYSSRSAGPGKVVVETNSLHLTMEVFSRYEATEKSIRPLYSKIRPVFFYGMLSGLALASALALTGYLIAWRERNKKV